MQFELLYEDSIAAKQLLEQLNALYCNQRHNIANVVLHALQHYLHLLLNFRLTQAAFYISDSFAELAKGRHSSCSAFVVCFANQRLQVLTLAAGRISACVVLLESNLKRPPAGHWFWRSRAYDALFVLSS